MGCQPPSVESIIQSNNGFVDIELFAGGGGMAVGLRAAGFCPALFYEADTKCCQTLRNNCEGPDATLKGFVIEGKTENVDWSELPGSVRLLAAGAPCQPFSLGGKHKAHKDPRNLFPEVLRAVRETKPIAVLLENVRGITRNSFRKYFEYVLRQLKFPAIAPRQGETWRDHYSRLKKLTLREAPEYNVTVQLLDAADFGVPQNRLRVFIVATRRDFPIYKFPEKTHSREVLEQLLQSKEYWQKHKLTRPTIRIPKKNQHVTTNNLLPWVTVRDAISDLPVPAQREDEAELNHWVIPGARSYEGHTGSILDFPAKTIKAGVHGVPGGENMIADDSGKLRYFTLRETARVQSFPDKHVFFGARSHITRQIGNAVPCRLTAAVATQLYTLISNELAAKSGPLRTKHRRGGKGPDKGCGHCQCVRHAKTRSIK
jgi:DNA (cytosine-5)-methyltransferase 1